LKTLRIRFVALALLAIAVSTAVSSASLIASTLLGFVTVLLRLTGVRWMS